MYVQLADCERRVVLEHNHLRLASIDRAAVERAACDIDRDAELARDALRAADVIVVLVRDDQRAELLDVPSDELQPLARLARPETGVDEDGGAVALEVVRI